MTIALEVTSFDSRRTYFEPYGLSCVYWQPSAMERADHHNEIELNFLKSGSVTYLHGGKKTVVKAGKLSAFWAAIPHQIVEYSCDSAYFVATIPLSSFIQWRMPENFFQALMHGHFLSEPTTECAHMDAQLFERWESDLRSCPQELEKPVLLELQARLLRMASNFVAPIDFEVKRENSGVIRDVGLSKVEQMACFIAQNYMRRITVKEVSELVHLHPNYAMNIFRSAFGTTLINYLTQHRISHAQRLLATTNLPVTEIALQSGFSSISRFNEAFNQSCGCSPRSYRKSQAG